MHLRYSNRHVPVDAREISHNRLWRRPGRVMPASSIGRWTRKPLTRFLHRIGGTLVDARTCSNALVDVSKPGNDFVISGR